MPPAQGSILNYFQRSPAKPTASSARDETPSSQPLSQPDFSAAGKVIISSSDAEESDSDSNSSLVDVTELFQRRGPTPRPPPLKRQGNIAVFLNQTPPRRVLATKQLRALVEESELAAAADAESQRLDALIASLDDQQEEQQQQQQQQQPRDAATTKPNDGPAVNKELLTVVLADHEEDDVSSLLKAIKRTGAAHTRARWRFFVDPADTTTLPFPALPATSPWKPILEQPASRCAALTTGFVADLVRHGPQLPPAVLRWMLQSLGSEPRADVRQAYADVLRASPAQLSSAVDVAVLAGLFLQLGASETTIDPYKSAEAARSAAAESGDDSPPLDRPWDALVSVVDVLGQIAASIADNVAYVIVILIRLSMDVAVIARLDVLAAVQRSLSQLCAARSASSWNYDCQRIVADVYAGCSTPSLQLQMLRCMPAGVPRVRDLRGRLALAFFLDDPHGAAAPAAQRRDLAQLAQRLRGRAFKVTDATDYHALAARVSLLDLAVDNGRYAGDRLDDNDPDAEDAFNAQVDALDAQVRALWASINDHGASFIARLQAKAAMDILHHRLVHAVRTRPRVKQSVFDSATAVEADARAARRQAALMEGFLGRAETQPVMNT